MGGVLRRMNWLFPGWKRWLEAVAGFFYPDGCQCCRLEPAGVLDGYVGEFCRSSIRRCEPPFCSRCGLPYEGRVSESFDCWNCRELELDFDWARAVVHAGGVALEVIHRYKYRSARWFEPFLGGLLAEGAGLSLRGKGWDGLVPVPLHPLKEREREFNQAGCLAGYLSRASGVPVRSGLLARLEYTRSQTRLGRASRAENVARAFQFSGGESVKGQRLVVVDDVLTTGATTSACAGVLKAAGAREVGVWTLARGI